MGTGWQSTKFHLLTWATEAEDSTELNHNLVPEWRSSWRRWRWSWLKAGPLSADLSTAAWYFSFQNKSEVIVRKKNCCRRKNIDCFPIWHFKLNLSNSLKSFYSSPLNWRVRVKFFFPKVRPRCFVDKSSENDLINENTTQSFLRLCCVWSSAASPKLKPQL